MKKLFLIFMFLILPVYAGSFEDALAKNDKVFLFLYTPDCRTCNHFDSVYNDLQTEFKDYGFVKVNADTSYGRYLMMKYKGRYVPYILLADSKTKKTVNVHHSCVMDSVCLIRAMKSFKG